MYVTQLFEAQEPSSTLVIYPGRFQPWHKGHRSVYEHLVRLFGRDNVFIATSNKVDPPRSPFSFAEKLQFMQLTGIPMDRVIETRDPYRALEIVQNYDPNTTRLIFAVSEKDMDEDPRFKFGYKKDGSPTYLQAMPKNPADMQPFEHHGYVMTVPTFQFTVLGKPMLGATDVRAQFANADNETQKNIVADLFGRYSPEIHSLMKHKITESKSSNENKKQVVAERINSAILDKRFEHTQEIGDYTYTAKSEDFEGAPLLWIKAYDGDKQIGEVLFEIIVRSPGGKRMPSADYLESGGTEVDPAYRNKGVASTMYAYAKMLGNDIRPSYNQKGPGKAMWAAWEKAGDAKHLVGTAAEGVAEGLNEEDPLELSSDYALYIANAGRVMMAQLTNLSKKIQTDSTAAQNAKLWNLGDYMHQHYKTDDMSAINQVFEEYGVGGFFDQDLYELLANWSSQGAEYVNTWKQYSSDVIKNSTRKPGGVVHEQGVAEVNENPYRRPSPGEVAKVGQQTKAKLNPARSQFVWKKPNQISGSFTDQQLLAKGFKKSQFDSWGGTQAMWDSLMTRESALDRPTPTAQEVLNKHNMTPNELMTQLKIGVKVELEHTTDSKVAYEIALDHINERPDYYTALTKAGLEEDAAGVGVIAKNKKMARDPRYSMSITKDVRPGQDKKNLRAWRLIK